MHNRNTSSRTGMKISQSPRCSECCLQPQSPVHLCFPNSLWMDGRNLIKNDVYTEQIKMILQLNGTNHSNNLEGFHSACTRRRETYPSRQHNIRSVLPNLDVPVCSRCLLLLGTRVHRQFVYKEVNPSSWSQQPINRSIHVSMRKHQSRCVPTRQQSAQNPLLFVTSLSRKTQNKIIENQNDHIRQIENEYINLSILRWWCMESKWKSVNFSMTNMKQFQVSEMTV